MVKNYPYFKHISKMIHKINAFLRLHVFSTLNIFIVVFFSNFLLNKIVLNVPNSRVIEIINSVNNILRKYLPNDYFDCDYD